MAFDPLSERLIVAGLGGQISSFDPSPSDQRVTPLFDSGIHGTPSPLMGLAIASDGTMYLVGNDTGSQDGFNIGVVRRGTPTGSGDYTWSTVATTAPFPRSKTPFDHNLNSIVLSPDETQLFLNSGSRTDHGELQESNGQFPGVREVPLTSAILRIPASASDLYLEDDEDFLVSNGYLFADGTRNTFSMAFDGSGRLFGTENSGDRDDMEELNLLEEGKHYGFPWRMGLGETPMQFPDYDPAADLLLNPQSFAAQNNYFYNDPAYPSPPPGVTFTDPVLNVGTVANLYRDPSTGQIRDADATGQPIGSFTPHRSPLGLVFDVDGDLPAPYTGNGLMLSWTGPESDLLGPFIGEGEDLLMLDIEVAPSGPTLQATRLASGFQNPIDAVLLDGALYILEWGSNARVWQLTFPSSTATESALPSKAPTLSVYPNPTRDELTVRLEEPDSMASDVQVLLYAVDGREVIRSRISRPESGLFSLSVDGLSAGTYFLVVRDETHALTKPVIVY